MPGVSFLPEQISSAPGVIDVGACVVVSNSRLAFAWADVPQRAVWNACVLECVEVEFSKCGRWRWLSSSFDAIISFAPSPLSRSSWATRPNWLTRTQR